MCDHTPMTEQAPTTDEVRSGFVESWIGDGSVTDQDHDRIWGAAEFDRWLAAHDAHVKAEALREAAAHIESTSTLSVNHARPMTGSRKFYAIFLRQRADAVAMEVPHE